MWVLVPHCYCFRLNIHWRKRSMFEKFLLWLIIISCLKFVLLLWDELRRIVLIAICWSSACMWLIFNFVCLLICVEFLRDFYYFWRFVAWCVQIFSWLTPLISILKNWNRFFQFSFLSIWLLTFERGFGNWLSGCSQDFWTFRQKSLWCKINTVFYELSCFWRLFLHHQIHNFLIEWFFLNFVKVFVEFCCRIVLLQIGVQVVGAVLS